MIWIYGVTAQTGSIAVNRVEKIDKLKLDFSLMVFINPFRPVTGSTNRTGEIECSPSTLFAMSIYRTLLARSSHRPFLRSHSEYL